MAISEQTWCLSLASEKMAKLCKSVPPDFNLKPQARRTAKYDSTI
jgi:hypothetical protein